MKNETTSLRQSLALAASLIFHSTALIVLSTMPMSTPLQKSGDIVTVDIQDKSAQTTTEVAATETPATSTAAAPTPVPAPAPVVPAEPLVKAPVKSAPKVVAEPVAPKTPIAKAASKPAPIKTVKAQTALPEKISDSKSASTVAVNEVESSPETAADVDADAAALMESANEQNEKPESAPILEAPVVKQTPKTIAKPVQETAKPAQGKETPAAENIIAKPISAPTPAPETTVAKNPIQNEGKPAEKSTTGSGDGAQASKGSPEGIPAGVISEAQLGLPVYSVKPYYPSMDKVRGYQGQADILYTVKPDGSVSNIRVFKSSGSTAMDQSAVKALAYFKYHPQPKETEVMKSFAYRLSGTAQELPARLRQAGAQAPTAKN